MALRMVAREDAVERDGFSNPNIPKIATGHRRNLIEYFGPASGNLGPDVTDVHMTNRTIGAHSHEVDEFQLLFGKPGAKFQGKAVPSLLVHYSDAFAVYGPLEGGDDPFHLIQIRAEPIDHAKGGPWGDFRVPDDRPLMPYVSHRHDGGEVPELSEHERLSSGDVKEEQLMGPAEDGMSALLITAGRGSQVALPSAKETSGQCVYVVNGSVVVGERSYGPGAIGWQDQENETVGIAAGELGCRVLVMRFPFPSSKAAVANKLQPFLSAV